MNPRVSNDRGNIALELVSVGLLVPILIVSFALSQLAIQRTALAALQLAKQSARLESLGHFPTEMRTQLISQVAGELNLQPSEITIQTGQSEGGLDLQGISMGSLIWAKVSVSGHTETAIMRTQE